MWIGHMEAGKVLGVQGRILEGLMVDTRSGISCIHILTIIFNFI